MDQNSTIPLYCSIHFMKQLFDPMKAITNMQYLFQAWVKLFNLAESSIEIVSYHWGLQRGSGRGQSVYDTLVDGKY